MEIFEGEQHCPCINENEGETGFGYPVSNTCHTLVVQTELKLMRLERQLADEV